MLSRRHLIGTALASAVAPAVAQGRPLQVVTTTAMIADAARRIGGDAVAVKSLFGEGVDPHTYKPTRSDIVQLNGAELVLIHGLGLEAQFAATFAQLSRTKSVKPVGEAVPPALRLEDEEVKGKPDPHVWMAPDLWLHVVAAVRDALIAALPDRKAALDSAHDAYATELRTLHNYCTRIIATIPPERRILVTAHDAFGYFARAYGLTVEGIQGISTESEAGLRRIEDVVTLVATKRIPAIFVETSVSDRNIRAVAEGAERRGHRLTIGAALFSDAMGATGTYEGTYIGMIDHNATTIARALGGTPPARGLNDRLSP